jgi:hypothetical protein
MENNFCKIKFEIMLSHSLTYGMKFNSGLMLIWVGVTSSKWLVPVNLNHYQFPLQFKDALNFLVNFVHINDDGRL